MTKSDQLRRENKALSLREIEILTWAARGKTNSEISMILSLAERTVKAHIEQAGSKLNTTNKVHTIAEAVSRQLIKL